MSNPNTRRLILAIFCLSGACALIYEITWTRMMTRVFGITVFAVTTVLCSFMAGLGLGSFLSGRFVDRMRRVLPLYGALEIGIGIFALLFPLIVEGLKPLFVSLHHRLYVNYYVFSLVRFLVIFTVLLIPTCMMGATFPLLARYFIRARLSVGRDVGFLYAINTSGAVIGTFLAGFLMLAFLGISKTIFIAAAVNIAIGIVCIFIGLQQDAPVMEEGVPDKPEDSSAGTYAEATVAMPSSRAWLILAAIGTSGFVSLGLEVLWTRVLVLYVHNSTYAFSTMLGVFLFGLAVGSWIYSAVAGLIRRPMVFFAALELGIAFWTVLSLYLVGRLPRVMDIFSGLIRSDNWYEALILMIIPTAIILFVPTLLMGMTLPLATSLIVTRLENVGRHVAKVYAINTFGTVLGSFTVGFVLIHFLGIRNSFLVLVALNGLIAAALLAGAPGLIAPLKWTGVAGSLAFVVTAQLVVPANVILNKFEQTFGKLLFYKEEVTDIITVSEMGMGWEMRTLIFGDGRGTAGHWTRMEDRFYGHLPVLLHDDPKDVLVICFGVGNTLGAIGRHKDIETIDFVELSPGVVEAAQFFDTNYNILDDPRVHPHFEDGRNYLLATEKSYDIIHLDPPELHTAGVVDLYTEEFYELCKKRLRPGGIMSHWFNVMKLEAEETRMLIATFRKMFPHTTVWQGPGNYSFNLIGSDHPLRIPMAKFSSRLREPAVLESLAEWRLTDPAVFLTLLLMNEETVTRYSKGARTLTDDLTIIDFSSPRTIHSGFGLVSIHSATRFLQPNLPVDPFYAERDEFIGGGLDHMIELELKTDSVVDLIDWSGIPPDQAEADKLKIQEVIESRGEYLKRLGSKTIRRVP